MADPGFGYLFHVTIDGVSIGTWTECSGLGVQYEIEEVKEGGQNMFVHKLPGRASYENIRLKRPVDGESGALAAWFASVLGAWETNRTTASISVFDGNRGEVAAWHLVDVVPVRWTGPSLQAKGSDVATEELELAHHGFTYG